MSGCPAGGSGLGDRHSRREYTANPEVEGNVRADRTHPQAASRFHFARHLVEMFVSMQVGMMLGAFLLAVALGTSVAEAKHGHPVAWVIVMALDMTIPMVAVMLYRGHSRRSTAEMAAAMIVPALPIVALQLSHVGGNVGGAYMCLSMVAMIALIVYRRNEYRAAGHA